MHALHYFCWWSDLSEEKHEAKLNGIEEKEHAQKFIYESKLLHQLLQKTVNYHKEKQ